MSRSKKWRLEWAFFLGDNGRRQYNHICKKCVHGCKQSFRACLVACPYYNSKRSKICVDMGGKNTDSFPVSVFSKGAFIISHVSVCLLAHEEKGLISDTF